MLDTIRPRIFKVTVESIEVSFLEVSVASSSPLSVDIPGGLNVEAARVKVRALQPPRPAFVMASIPTRCSILAAHAPPQTVGRMFPGRQLSVDKYGSAASCADAAVAELVSVHVDAPLAASWRYMTPLAAAGISCRCSIIP